MPFVDEIRISAQAGDGGDGVVRWLHEKGKEFGGPSGGNGGKGGDVVVRAVRDLNVLSHYRGRTRFKAENGASGSGKEMTGKDGTPTTIDVPVGAHIVDVTTNRVWDLLEEGAEAVLLSGGRGGMGNARYKSSVNQYPTEATPGAEGERGAFLIEVRLIADVGLVGLPNAGKSSLLNAMTRAGAKVGAYRFTTLEPNLGVFHTCVIADIPGLIEGASAGKGLGHTFLRHVRRTRVLLHCVSAEHEDPSRIYEIVRGELAAYDAELARKPEIIFLTKADMVAPDILARRTTELAKFAPVVQFSIIDDQRIRDGGEALIAFLAAHA